MRRGLRQEKKGQGRRQGEVHNHLQKNFGLRSWSWG